MIRAQYKDCVIFNQLYCSFQVQREIDDGTYDFLYMVNWFGSAEFLIPEARGELLALAATVGQYRNELMLISPQINTKPDEALTQWRNRFSRIQYCEIDEPISDLLAVETKLISELNERSIVNEIHAENLTTEFLCNTQNANDQQHSIVYDINNIVLALVDPPFTVLGFRKPINNNHLREIILQANEHNLLLYVSSSIESGLRILANGPWVLFPSKLRNVDKDFSNTHIDFFSIMMDKVVEETDKKILNDIRQEVSEPKGIVENLTDLTPPSSNLNTSQPDESEILMTPYGSVTCSFCSSKFKKISDLSDHLRTEHPEHDDSVSNDQKSISNTSSLVISPPDVLEILMTPDGNVICPFCHDEFKKIFGLSNHVRTKHSEHYDTYRSTIKN